MTMASNLRQLTLAAFVLACGFGNPALASDADRTASPDGAQVYFLEPANGATVASPVSVKFGLRGMGVAPAGIEKAKTGHHHLIIDTELEAWDEPIPADENHRHFGGGQTETSVELAPGTHTLQLIVGDHNHIPHLPPVRSQKITITVK